jgi:hypothetical protein
MVVLGILVVSLFGLGLDWRLISAIEAVFPVILVLSMIYVPESPYYLVKKGSTFLFQQLTHLEFGELLSTDKGKFLRCFKVKMNNYDILNFLFPDPTKRSTDVLFFKITN